MPDAFITALGPAVFGLLGTVVGGLITYSASASQRRVDQDNGARDKVLQMLLLVDLGAGRYARDPAGQTVFHVSPPRESADSLWDRFRELQVDLLAAGFSWPITRAALSSAWAYVDGAPARARRLAARDAAPGRANAAPFGSWNIPFRCCCRGHAGRDPSQTQ